MVKYKYSDALSHTAVLSSDFSLESTPNLPLFFQRKERGGGAIFSIIAPVWEALILRGSVLTPFLTLQGKSNLNLN